MATLKSLFHRSERTEPPPAGQGSTVVSTAPTVPRESPSSWPPAPAGVCDICNGPVQDAGSARVPGGELKDLVRKGYNPYERGRASSLARALFPGDDSAVYENWKMMVFADSTDWGLCGACAADLLDFKGPSVATEATTQPAAESVVGTEHYQLRCRDCGFTHDIPTRMSGSMVEYSVDEDDVKIVCVYGGRFTVTLKVDDFFTLAKAPAQGLELKAEIAANMQALHSHLMTHHDPLFLIIEQHPNATHHEYKKAPEGDTYVRFSGAQGIDIVGDINVAKAEIPGVS